jgi:hypothetical protein
MPNHKFQINRIRGNQFVEVEVFDGDKSVLTQNFEITSELDFNEIKRLVNILIKKKANLDDHKSKLGKKFPI